MADFKAPDSWYEQSGVIPYRKNGKAAEILLITSRRKKNWIIPKGIAESWMTPQESAGIEAFEEAGVSGNIADKPVGEYKSEKWGGVCTVTVYPMEVVEEYPSWPEDDFRSRKWMPADEAHKIISNKKLSVLVKKFAEKLGKADK